MAGLVHERTFILLLEYMRAKKVFLECLIGWRRRFQVRWSRCVFLPHFLRPGLHTNFGHVFCFLLQRALSLMFMNSVASSTTSSSDESSLSKWWKVYPSLSFYLQPSLFRCHGALQQMHSQLVHVQPGAMKQCLHYFLRMRVYQLRHPLNLGFYYKATRLFVLYRKMHQ